ncbi:hypothetical protein [Haloferula sp. BvORR071]|uniref:hypothetical protein n=1 Tax=Haloferula sp. BvORR071 TaxID=1396141 RepID=UPI000550806C|nr:hypothetical protein [Haloferula sp. BvORR071]
MNTPNNTPLPDSTTVAAELELNGIWDTAAVSELIRSKCENGETPAFLFLGMKEAALLRQHLAQAFGAEAVATLRDTYYMGLEVVEIEVESFVYTGGRKAIRTLQDPISRRPAWRDRGTETMWQFRI